MTVAGAPLHETVLEAQSALNTTHTPVFAAHCSVVRAFVLGSAGVVSGAVTLEGSPTKDFAGTWVSITGAVTAVADTVVQIIGVNAAYPYVRARISTVIGGGTVTVMILGN